MSQRMERTCVTSHSPLCVEVGFRKFCLVKYCTVSSYLRAVGLYECWEISDKSGEKVQCCQKVEFSGALPNASVCRRTLYNPTQNVPIPTRCQAECAFPSSDSEHMGISTTKMSMPIRVKLLRCFNRQQRRSVQKWHPTRERRCSAIPPKFFEKSAESSLLHNPCALTCCSTLQLFFDSN